VPVHELAREGAPTTYAPCAIHMPQVISNVPSDKNNVPKKIVLNN
jgi:hypothetical protein